MKTKKEKIILFFLLFFVNLAIGQSITFKKVYPAMSSVGSQDYKVVCKPFNNDKSFLITSPILFKINSFGEVIKVKYFLDIGGTKNHFILNNDASLTLYGNYAFNKNLSKLDTSLNIIFTKKYALVNGPFWGNDRNIIDSVYENGYIISGSKHDTTLIARIDSVGNVIWGKYFSSIQGGVQDIIQIQDRGFVIAVNLKNEGASLIKTDVDGNVLWAKSYFRPRGYIHNVLENTDGTILITGNLDSLYSFQNNSSSLFFVKLNQTGNVLWAKTFGDTVNMIRNYASDTKHTQDGGYITLTTLTIPTHLDDLLLIKTEANGDTLWVRAHGSTQSWDIGQSVEQLGDKGYILSGVTNNNIPLEGSYLYIVRTDSLGHTDSLCEEYSIPLAINNISVNDSDITVTSVSFSISISTPDTSTEDYPTIAYDGCHLDGITELLAENKEPLIYPNPTEGQFTIEIKTNTPEKSDVEIYNITGEKVFSLCTEKSDVNIDLTGYPSGLYFVRIINKQFSKSGKIILE